MFSIFLKIPSNRLSSLTAGEGSACLLQARLGSPARCKSGPQGRAPLAGGARCSGCFLTKLLGRRGGIGLTSSGTGGEASAGFLDLRSPRKGRKHLRSPQPGGRGPGLPAAPGRAPGEGRAARPADGEPPQPIGAGPGRPAASAGRLARQSGCRAASSRRPARSSAAARLYGQPRRWGRALPPRPRQHRGVRESSARGSG